MEVRIPLFREPAFIQLGFIFGNTHANQYACKSSNGSGNTNAREGSHDWGCGDKWAESRNRKGSYAEQPAQCPADSLLRNCLLPYLRAPYSPSACPILLDPDSLATTPKHYCSRSQPLSNPLFLLPPRFAMYKCPAQIILRHFVNPPVLLEHVVWNLFPGRQGVKQESTLTSGNNCNPPLHLPEFSFQIHQFPFVFRRILQHPPYGIEWAPIFELTGTRS